MSLLCVVLCPISAMLKHGFEGFFRFFAALPVTFVAVIMGWFISINDYISTKSLCDATQLSTREPKKTDVKKKVYTLIWGILLDRAPGFYRAFHVLRANLPWASVVAACTQQLWVGTIEHPEFSKWQWEPFQYAYHHSLSEWKTNIQTIHLMETESGKWGCALVLFPSSLCRERAGKHISYLFLLFD